MDFAVVTSLLGIVEEQLLQKPRPPNFILPDDTQIILSLKDKLLSLQAYLQFPKPIITSDPDAVKRLDEEIRDVAVKAEDEIESKLSDNVYLAYSGEDNLHQTLQQVVKDIESVEMRIRDLHLQQQITPPHSLGLEKFLEAQNEMIIGAEDEFKKIRKMLVDWRSKPQAVISIVGDNNTSLARRLYEDPSIMYHFPIQAWTTVSPLREFNETRQLLFQLLGSIDDSLLTTMFSDDDEDADHLGKLLYQELIGQRYLIVIDGIRTQKAWDDIRSCFPDDLNGSRILITTRIMGVAKYASSSIIEVVQGNTMIGLEDEFEKIRDVLIRNHHEREVISVVGRCGAGKTTLAQKVYCDPLVLSQFEIRAWITVSQEFSMRMALLGIIGCIVSVTNEISKADDTEYLADRLRNILRGQRYLIVIDGIGTTKLWDHLQTCFPNDLNGSGIVITTQTISVARDASRSDEYIHEIGSLTSEESWDLFVKTLMFNPSPDHESIGRKIVEMCGGLPLSIVICAGILANHKMPPEDWEDVAQKIDSTFKGKESHPDYSEITALIYNNLPSHLRACFLYLGIFPKGSVIPVKKLINLWMAEGFLMSKIDKSLEDIAQDSLNDLITRSILVVEKWSFDGKVESCRIRNSLHDFCLKKAREDNTLVVSNEYCGDLARTWLRLEQSQLGCRWMSCQSHFWPFTEPSSFNYTLSKIRSILHFGKDLFLAKYKFIFPYLKLLRVLDLSLVKYWNGMPSEIVNLIHLRYLALTTTGSLYNFQLFKLQNLQTLILSSWMEECPLQLPCDILNLHWLRHVRLDKGSSLYLPNSIKGNLQTLFWLKVACWETATTVDFTMVPNLKELGIYIEGEMSANTLDNLTQLYQLQILKFEMGRVKRFYLPLSFPPNIKKLSLRNTNLSWEEMDIIGKLSNLEVLKLKEFAFCGPKWEPREVCFYRLKFLLIVHLDLKHWNASANNFPALECLVLRCCCHLKDLPSDMAWISSLRLIELIDCCPSLVKSAMRINLKQMFSCGTDGLVVRHSLTKDELAMEDEKYEVGSDGEKYEVGSGYEAESDDENYEVGSGHKNYEAGSGHKIYEVESDHENYEVGSDHKNYEVGSDDEKFGLEKVWIIKQAHQFENSSSRTYKVGSDDEHFGLRKLCKSPLVFVVVTSLLGVMDQHLLGPNPFLKNILDDPQIAVLSKKICSLRYMLEKSEIQTVDESLDAKIRDVAVEAEAKIESKLREVYLATSSKGDGVVEAASRGLRETLQYVVKDIESLEAQIKIHKESLPVKEPSIPVAVKAVSTLISGSSYHNLPPGNEMIGCDDEFQKICELLRSKPWSRDREVVVVTGMGGIGKSTLARRVYDSSSIRSYFDICAWTVVSHQHNVKEMVLCLLGEMRIGIYTTDDEELADELHRMLMGRRYLIVLDDIWSTKAWDDIKSYFPNNTNGSRILMTTQIMQVATHVTSSESSFICHMPFLNLDESWNLFVREVFKRRDCPPPPELEPIGRKIVEKCGGLPMAIVEIAGLLVQFNMSPDSWKDFAQNINSALMTVESCGHTVSSTLSLSYNNLPIDLQACFLYLGIFPKDSDIYVKKLIKLWVAEGFLEPRVHKHLEEVAMNCLNDLIARNLVLVVERNIDKKVKSCRLHALVQGFCLRKAQEENMVVVSNDDLAGTWSDTKQSKLGCRWISCQSRHWPFTRSSSLNDTQGKIHSILYFGEDLYLTKCRLMFPCFELLRVLDLSSIKYSNGMPGEIVNLIHLRYLALTTIGSLHNSQLFKLQSLQTLILFSWKKEFHFRFPCDILDLPWLRHVHLDKGSSLYLPNSIQGNLQTLLWLKVNSWDTKTPDFRMVPNLKELGIYIEGEVSSDALDSLAQLHQLEKLKFEARGIDHFNLPVSFPSSIKKLTFCKTSLPWKEMDVISKLPNLEVLKLEDFAFCGSKWEPSEGRFQALKFLLIAHSDLKHWNTSYDHFSNLKRLVLKYCWDLVNIPIEFAEIYTLESIELESCYSSLAKSAEKIKDEQQECGNDLLIIRKLGIKDKMSEEESETEEED